MAQPMQSVFSKESVSKYYEAVDLNEAMQYNEAYQTIVSADRMMFSEMHHRSSDVMQLNPWDFNMYCSMQFSMAEISYKLGLYAVMEEVSARLSLIGDGLDDYQKARHAKIKAGIYYLKGKYTDAESELFKAMGLWTFDVGFTQSIRVELAQLYYAEKYYEKAIEQLEEALGALEAQVSHGNRLEYSDHRYKELKSHQALCLARLGQFEEAEEEIDAVFEEGNAEWLRRKAKIMMLQYDRTGVYNPMAESYYRDYLLLARRYVDDNFLSFSSSEREQYWLAEKTFVTDCYRLEDKDPRLLYDVTLFSKAVLLQLGKIFTSDMDRQQKSEALAAVRVTWRDVLQSMPKRSSAVEFIIYEKRDTACLGALVLNKNASSPVFVGIGPISKITSMCYSEGISHPEMPSILWNDRLIEAISGSDNVYFATDGILHQIPIEYFIPEKMEKKNLYRVTSTRILAEDARPESKGNLFIVGGIDYRSERKDSVALDNDAQAYSVMSSKHLYLKSLEESGNEVKEIIAFRDNGNDTMFVGYYATESVVRSLINRYDMVHFATHGYFADDIKGGGSDLIPMSSDVQLSRSCIFMAGTQHNLEDENFNSTAPDGIISARELAAMDLSNVDLVALSACQSGLGYITADGVFGLQRGLKTAGAGAIIVSLWDVNDDAASAFFQKLYRNLESGKSIHQAFTDAREYLMKAKIRVKRRRAGLRDITQTVSFDKERYYNAFILIDGI